MNMETTRSKYSHRAVGEGLKMPENMSATYQVLNLWAEKRTGCLVDPLLSLEDVLG